MWTEDAVKKLRLEVTSFASIKELTSGTKTNELSSTTMEWLVWFRTLKILVELWRGWKAKSGTCSSGRVHICSGWNRAHLRGLLAAGWGASGAGWGASGALMQSASGEVRPGGGLFKNLTRVSASVQLRQIKEKIKSTKHITTDNAPWISGWWISIGREDLIEGTSSPSRVSEKDGPVSEVFDSASTIWYW